jgi:phosphoenolpyruvate synthase/pyruvate phosphate dikinase
MDTVLNLGMNDDVVQGLAQKTDNPRFAWDSYRRFLEMFGNVVLDIPRSLFEDELDDIKYEKDVHEDSDLSSDDLQELVGRFKKVYESQGTEFPQDVYEQLKLASKSQWSLLFFSLTCKLKYPIQPVNLKTKFFVSLCFSRRRLQGMDGTTGCQVPGGGEHS